MRAIDKSSREIIEILADVVKNAAGDCIITVPDIKGNMKDIKCPALHYVFGNTKYVKEHLDELSKNAMSRFPLIALFCPFIERRDSPDYYSKSKVRILIAHSTSRLWNNEQRLETSFKKVLRPIYNGFLKALKEDGRFDFGYNEHVDHEYSENYSYGKYGAYTDTGEEVSEPIDAINITNLELIVKLPNCTVQ